MYAAEDQIITTFVVTIIILRRQIIHKQSHCYRSNNNNNKMSYLSMWSAAAFLFCLQMGSIVATSNIDNMPISTTNENDGTGIVSLKLIPHHVELNRRQRERNLLEDDHVEEESYSRRREEAVQVGALFEVSMICNRIWALLLHLHFASIVLERYCI